MVITIVPWQLGEDDVVEGRQRVNDPFLRVGVPTSSESNVHADEQPANAHDIAEESS